MTPRDRYVATLLFHEPDRIPFEPGGARQSTLNNWHKQGLPPEVSDYVGFVRKLLDIEPETGTRPPDSGIDFRMIPQFEEKVIERRPGSLIVQDWKGNVCEISDEFDVTYLRNPVDFVTRSWIRCPVESRNDWEEMARRYDVNDPSRFATDFQDRAAGIRNRTRPKGLTINGPFWQLREWLGFENLCMLLLDDPDFAMEMVRFWEQFVAVLLERAFKSFVPDYILICEDMAYKVKPMISPEMCREFLAPTWRRWSELARGAGVPIIEIDSDGCVDQLIPVWIESGINCNSPQEVAAGNDLPAFRKLYGTKMAYRGGVDKRAMARGGKAMEQEMARLRPAIDAGGFIPSCDHGIPSDVSWPNFIHYCRLLAEATGWLQR